MVGNRFIRMGWACISIPKEETHTEYWWGNLLKEGP
jgi:hypothetical protein